MERKQVYSNQAKSRNPHAAGGPGVRRTFSPGSTQQYDHEVLEVARVVRVVKGGRRFSFRACVVVGNRSGKIGLGMGKSKDVQAAINKGYEQGAKRIITVPLKDGTIAHEVRAKFNGSKVMLKPAKSGTGIVAGGTIRLVADLVGLRNMVTKRWGSPNKANTAKAALLAFQKIRIGNK